MAIQADTPQVDDFFIPDGSEDPFESQENTPAPAPAAPAAAAIPAEAAPTARELRDANKRVEEANRRAEAAETSARFWSEKAGSAAPAPAKVDAPAIDLLEVMTSGDEGKFKAALKQMGYVSGAEVTSQIEAARSSARVDARLESTYPELKDSNSPMFKETQKAYQSLVAEEPAMRSSPKTILIAARLAKATLDLQGLDEHDDDDDDEEEPILAKPAKRAAAPARESEPERVRRVASQSPQRGKRPAANADSNELDAMQKLVVRKFQDAGSDITEESYKARASRGVRMSGIRATRG